MTLVRRTFVKGKMNKDIDERLLAPGEYRDAQNIQLANSEGSDVGAIEKELSNKVLTNLIIGTNIKTIGEVTDEFDQKIYTLLKSSTGCYVVEYDVLNAITTFVLKDTRTGSANVLQFDEHKLITGIEIIIDTDNNNRFLIFTDNNTQPKFLNIERAKTYAENGFTEEMILLIKKPPLYAPSILLSKIDSEENNIEEKFISFSSRNKYLDGEYSALSPFSEIAFMPKNFDYDYSTGTNESMVNANNIAYVTIDSGGPLVTDVEVVFKESGKNNIYLIEKYNKEEKNWADNTLQTISFNNSKIYRVLPKKELFRLYDNVPLLAKDLTVINNILVFGNYTENYNLLDAIGYDINVNLTVSKVSTPIVANTPTKSLKSNRSLEIGIAYLDDYGRLTTPLTSQNNNIYIPNSDSLNQNQLKVVVKNRPPYFAKKYRFFIKQNQGDYETIIPTLFYEEGSYRWVKLEKADIDKIKEGDILVIKSDTNGYTSKLIYTKILEIKEQPDNFLSNVIINSANNGSDIIEEKGLYFKIKPTGFRMNRSDFTFYEFDSYDDSTKKYSDPVRNLSAIIESAVYYGATGVDDLTSGGTFTGTTDIRYRIEIDGATTFKWSKDDGATWVASLVAITAGIAQTLDNGVQITIATGTGRITTDYWIVSAKYVFPPDGQAKAYGFYPSLSTENIESGARINLIFDEYHEHTEYINKSFISSKFYENLEEWFYGEGISVYLHPLTRIYFRRGILTSNGESKYFTQNSTGVMTMIIQGIGTQNSWADKSVKIRSHIDIFQSKDSKIVFETKPLDFNNDIFFEIGRTYNIDTNGFHLGYDTNDISQSTGINAEILLPVFNCFSWGNGYESYKIKDLFNAKTLNLDTRPSTPIDNYRRNKRIASFTWSRPYEQTTKYNALNEFNLSLVNFKDLDDSLGSIQRIESLNNDLDIWLENKVLKILYKKSILYNKDGSSNLTKSNLIFDGVIPYAGEFGISNNPEGLVIYGNYAYWPDSRRGVILRKGQSGIEVISNFGMRDWFKDIFKSNNLRILGGYDPYKGQYAINIKDIISIIDNIHVTSFILNLVSAQGLTLESNYNWFYDGDFGVKYKSSNTLGDGTGIIINPNNGISGKSIYPKTNSTITLECFVKNPIDIFAKIGYFIQSSQLGTIDPTLIRNAATYLTLESEAIDDGIRYFGSFEFLRPNNESYLYFVFDYQQVFRSAAITETIQKNDCGVGYTGTSITYSYQEGKFKSKSSQVVVDATAQSDFDATKQIYANANGTCIAIGGGILNNSLLKISSKQPDINNSGAIWLSYGEPNEVITLSFKLYYIHSTGANSIIFNSIAVTVNEANTYATANVTLNANGYFNTSYIITNLSNCIITIIGRNSSQQIPIENKNYINNIKFIQP